MRRRSHLAKLAYALYALGALVGCHDDSGKGGAGSVGDASRTATTPESARLPTGVVSPAASAPAVRRMQVYAAAAELSEHSAGLQLVAGFNDGAETADAAALVWSAEPAGVIDLDARGYARPLRPGRARVTARLGSEAATLELTVVAEEARSWSFRNELVPLLTKLGCNGGGCHGRADGQNGFHLSLFGYDPDRDHGAITRESGGRRINILQPSASLLLRKATGEVVHGGGRRLAPGSPEYALIRDWIAAGAPALQGRDPGIVTSIAMSPVTAALPAPATVQLRVLARCADGSTHDVTRLTQFRSLDDRVAIVTDTGLARLLARGEADIAARFGAFIATCRLESPYNTDLEFDFAGLPRANFIDEHVYKRLERLRVPPSPRASDALFLRRVSLDLTGQIPEPDEVKQFVASTDSDKRAAKVDELMSRREFLHFWKLKLGDLLQITPARIGSSAGTYEFWLENALRENRSWDRMVRELLTTLGDPSDRVRSAAANYALDAADPQTAAEQTSRRFLGLRMRCARCHDHPFDVWSQDAYYGLAAFFAKVDRGGGQAPGMMAQRARIAVNPEGVVVHERTKQPAAPRLLDGSEPEIANAEDPRAALADWMTRADNPFFARAAANWVWSQLFGRGIVEPADDMSAGNPPVHPELLDALARHFVESGFDMRALIKTIATSEVYGSASSTVPGNEHDQRLFSHQLARPLSAHQMADALARATQVPNVFSGNLGNKTNAIEVFNPTVASEILDTFGRCDRLETCVPSGSSPVSLRQSLLLIGGDVIDSKVSHINGYLARLLELEPSADEVVEFLYRRTLCRAPSDEERSHWAAQLSGAASQREAAEDLFWALLNSREFIFNH